ncbi:ABC transporter permease [Mycoplasmatota bacterium]|nr:ABC transporter permease [Mycoplasmatota bacterium]
MKTIFLLVWGNFKELKLQNLILAIVFSSIGVLFILSIRLFGSSTDYSDLYIESQTSQLLLIVEDQDTYDHVTEFLENHDAVKNVNSLGYFGKIKKSEVYSDETEPITLEMPFMTAVSETDYDQILIVEGKSQNELDNNEIIVSYGKTVLDGTDLGDQVIVYTENGSEEFIVAGIGIDLSFNVQTITLNRLWVTSKTIDNLNGNQVGYSIGVSYNQYTPEVEQNLLDEMKIELGEYSDYVTPYSHQILLSANSFFYVILGSIFTLLGVILMVVSLFIISSIIYNSIITETKKIAILKSTGFSSNNIISVYLIQYSILSIIGLLIGAVGSIILSKNVFNDLNELYRLQGLPYGINYLQLFFTILFLLVIIGVTVYLVSRKVIKVKPAVALQSGAESNENKLILSFKKYKKLPISLVLAFKDMLYNKKLTITSIMFIIATVFTIVTFSSISTTLWSERENTALWRGFEYDVQITNLKPQERLSHGAIINNLEESNQVQGTMLWYTDTNSQVLDEQKNQFVNYIGTTYSTNDSEPFNFQTLEGRIPSSDNEVMCGYNLMKTLNKTIGDYVTIKSLGKEQEFLIVGIYQNMSNSGLTFSLMLDEIPTNILPYSSIYVRLRDNVTEIDFNNTIANLFSDNVDTFYESANTSMISMMKTLKMVTTSVIILFSLICFIVMFSINITNLNKERFNYGIYKSIGMTNRLIMKIYLLKNLVISAIAIVPGIIISVIAIPFIMNSLSSILGIVDMPITFDTWGIILSIMIPVLVTILNSGLMKKAISKISPKELLVE